MIRARRTDKGLTRSDLARAAKVTPAYSTQLETGQLKNPSLDILKRISNALGVPVTELLE